MGLITYLPVGYPTLAETPGLVAAAVEGGACMVELGVPFSDPLADGTTIQRATAEALRQGISLADCLQMVKSVQDEGLEVPLLLMGYYNTFLSYGLDRFCTDAGRVGLDGVIITDLPPEEASTFLEYSGRQSLDMAFMLAPTSTEERIKKVAVVAQGFIYCVSLTGVTGARGDLPEHLAGFLEGVRAHTTLPLAVGFGISRGEHVGVVGRLAEAAVVGSALVDVIDRSRPEERAAAVRAFVSDLAAGAAARA